MALDLAKINKETLSPEGGEIIRHNDGSPAGVLVDTAGDQLTLIIPPYEGENQRNALLKGQEHLLAFGFTDLDANISRGILTNFVIDLTDDSGKTN